MANEIDELLGDKNGEGSQSGAPSDEKADGSNGEGNSDKKPTAVEEHDALMKANEALAREKQKILDDIAVLRGERREARAGKPQGASQEEQEQKPVEQVQVEETKLETTDDWKKLINKTAEDNAKKVVSTELNQIKDSQRKKAYKKFIEEHPEYSPAKDPEDKKFKALLETYKRVSSRTDMDADDILEDLQDSYAVLHRSEILDRERKAKRADLEQEISTADIAASDPSIGERDTAEAVVLTPSEMRIYREVIKMTPNITPKQFKKRLAEQSME